MDPDEIIAVLPAGTTAVGFDFGGLFGSAAFTVTLYGYIPSLPPPFDTTEFPVFATAASTTQSVSAGNYGVRHTNPAVFAATAGG
jgi:hypothetical protein